MVACWPTFCCMSRMASSACPGTVPVFWWRTAVRVTQTLTTTLHHKVSSYLYLEKKPKHKSHHIEVVCVVFFSNHLVTLATRMMIIRLTGQSDWLIHCYFPIHEWSVVTLTCKNIPHSCAVHNQPHIMGSFYWFQFVFFCLIFSQV